MYKCDCDENGNFSDSLFNLKPTEVIEDGVCVRCGNYARWVNKEEEKSERGTYTNTKLTVFKLREGEFKQFDNTIKASKYAGYSGYYSLSQKIKKDELPCHSTTLGVLVVKGHIDKIPQNYLKYNKPKKVFAYCYETGKLVAEGSIKELSKKLKEKENVIVSNLGRQTIKTKKGLIYSRNKNFNVRTYRDAVEAPVDDDFLKWRQDVIDYDESELGVNYEVDNYGTWKEKLYS